MTSLQHGLELFFSFKAYVMLPLIIFVVALVVRVPLMRAVASAVGLAAGFAGVFIAFNFFVANISPAVQQLAVVRGLNFPILDVGWPPLAAITWASPLAALSIPAILALNLLMVAFGWTRTIYIDIWNFWHFALVGALVLAVSDSMALGLTATLLIAVYCFKMSEWSAPEVEREMGLKGISASPVSVNGIVPYAACVDWLLDRTPLLKSISYNPQAAHAQVTEESSFTFSSLLGEPMVIGFLMGLALALAAGYDIKSTLETSVHIAAVMFLLPKSGELIGLSMMPITTALRDQVTRKFPQRDNLIVALDTGFMMGHKSVIMTGLILMALAILIALVLPGNQVLPLGDLPNLISVMSISVLLFRGNVFRAVLAGIPIIVSFLLIATEMAPLYTQLSQQTPAFNSAGLGLITAFTDGGNQIRFLIFNLFQGKVWAIVGLVGLVLAMTVLRQRCVTASAGPRA